MKKLRKRSLLNLQRIEIVYWHLNASAFGIAWHDRISANARHG